MADEFSLILYCGGSIKNGITICPTTTNILIDFQQHIEALKLEGLMDFLDYSCRLFDEPIVDWNKLVNVLKILRDKFFLISDKLWEGLSLWLGCHKKCGAVLRLVMNVNLPEYVNDEPDEELILPKNNHTTITP